MLSVVTVTFKDLCGLIKTINSVIDACLKESFPHVELIVIDGATEQEVTNYLNDIKLRTGVSIVLLSEPDDGIYDAMNKGLALARGSHVIYMNSGDCFHPDGLTLFLSQTRDPGVLYYGDAVFYSAGKLSFSFRADMTHSHCFLRHNCFSHQAIFYPTTLLKSLGGYRLDYPISSDFDLTWRCHRTDCRFEHLGAVIADCELGGISCQRGLQSYADRVASFHASGSWFYALLLKVYYPIFLGKNRLVHSLEGSRLLALYRKYKVR